MQVNWYAPEECFWHKSFPFLAERPERLEATSLAQEGLNIERKIARTATDEMLWRAHTRGYIEHVKNISEMNVISATLVNLRSPYLQYYTRVSNETYRAAIAACGAVCQAVDQTLTDKSIRAFCAVRPPGHHAGRAYGEGFCIFNNVAVGALHAHAQGARVAIIDFDRHHGNGTEEIIAHASSDKLLFISSFQSGCEYSTKYPEPTGSRSKTLRVPIPEHSGFSVVRDLYLRQVVPALFRFKPDVLLISAGFDMHENDPLTNLKLSAFNYGELTSMLVGVANQCRAGLVSILEGGYHLEALRACVLFHITALKEELI